MTTAKQSTALTVIERTLMDSLPDIATVATAAITPERLVRVTLSALADPRSKLHECTPESVLLACMNAAQLGLEPTGLLGEAYLIKYGNVCNLQVGYKGMIKLMKRTGDVRKVEAHEVFDVDDFDYAYGTAPFITHKPGDPSGRGAMSYSYAIAWLPEGFTQFEVMSPDEIAAVKKMSRGASSSDSPWSTFPAMMWRKSAVRRLANYIELSAEVRRAIAYDDAITIGETVSMSDIDPTLPEVNAAVEVKSAAKLDSLRERIEAQQDPASSDTGDPSATAETTDEAALAAKHSKAVKRKIGRAVQSASWEVETIKDFCQTLYCLDEDLLDDDGRVDMGKLSITQWEDVLQAVKDAATATTVGEAVQLASWGKPGESITLDAVAGTVAQ